jgi:uncharacterized OsmC-like protein
MKIILLSDDAIRLEPDPGPLIIEAPTAEMTYSPFHMVASGLASCTFSVLYSWATQAKFPVDDLTVEVQWRFADDPHRMADIGVIFDWPSLPAARVAAAKRVAEMCAVHATLTHPPRIDILAASELPAHEHDEPAHEHAPPSSDATRSAT